MGEQNNGTNKNNSLNIYKYGKKTILIISLVLAAIILLAIAISSFFGEIQYQVISPEQLPVQLTSGELQPGSSSYMEKNRKGYGVIVPLQGERVEILAVGKGKPGIDITYKTMKSENGDYRKEIKAVVFPNPFSKPVGFKKIP